MKQKDSSILSIARNCLPTRMAIALAMAGIPFLAGCGSNNGKENPVNPWNSPQYQCNGTMCYPVSPAGCIDIAQQITFSGDNAQIDSMNNIVAGAIPGTNQPPVGTLVTGVPRPVSGPNFTSIPGASGNFSMQVQSAAPGTYAATTGILNGTLQISSIMQQSIRNKASMGVYGGYQQPYNPTYPSVPYQPYTNGSVCVSGMALQGHLYTTGGYGFGGKVYLYLNNTSHGEILYFY